MDLNLEDVDMQFVSDTPDYAVLNAGYVKFIEYWGSDERIIESARMSTNKGFLGWGGAVCGKCFAANLLNENDNLYIESIAKDPNIPQAEAIEGRFADALNYLKLGYALLNEK